MTSTEQTSTASTFTVPRPTWAAETVSDQGAVTHHWDSPTHALADSGPGDGLFPSLVQAVRTDSVTVFPQIVQYEVGDERVVLADFDAWFNTTAEARKYAAAILECCDQIDGAQ